MAKSRKTTPTRTRIQPPRRVLSGSSTEGWARARALDAPGGEADAKRSP